MPAGFNAAGEEIGGFEVFSQAKAAGKIIDPKNFDRSILERVTTPHCVIPANSFALAVTLEQFNVPRGCIGLVMGKSTYSRCGIVVNVTPLEPEWRGHVTLEITNSAPIPAVVYAGEGIIQVIFVRADKAGENLVSMLDDYSRAGLKEAFRQVDHVPLDGLCRTSYADRKGRYQDQGPKVMLPCVRKVPESNADPCG